MAYYNKILLMGSHIPILFLVADFDAVTKHYDRKLMSSVWYLSKHWLHICLLKEFFCVILIDWDEQDVTIYRQYRHVPGYILDQYLNIFRASLFIHSRDKFHQPYVAKRKCNGGCFFHSVLPTKLHQLWLFNDFLKMNSGHLRFSFHLAL